MDGFLRKHAPRILGFAVALLALASLLSFHPQDPTLTNLRYPKDGVANWLGYPGALVGGSLVEGFGLAALLLPLLVANWFITGRERPAAYRYAAHGTALLIVTAAAIGMGAETLPLGLRGPGLVGWSAGHWVRATTGPWPGAALLAFAGIYSLAHVVYAPQLWRILGDAGVLSRFGMRQLWARYTAWWRQVRPQTGWAWHELPLLPLHALLVAADWLWERGLRRTLVLPVRYALQGWRERRYSVARVKSSPAAPVVPAAVYTPEEPPRFRHADTAAAPDAFAHWLEEPASPAAPLAASPLTPAPEAPRFPAPPAAAPILPLPTSAPATAQSGERVARWEEYLRRYKENLDLDWDERSWKRKRLEELAQDAPEGEGPDAPQDVKPT